jgi:hypothetical protein
MDNSMMWEGSSHLPAQEIMRYVKYARLGSMNGLSYLW